MKTFQNFVTITCFLLTFTSFYGQNKNQPITENDLEELLEIRKKLERENKLKDSYKIQLFSGNLDQAKEVKNEYDSNEDFSWKSRMIFETPNYKVWVGHYRNRLEADRALQIILEEFEDALILKPGRG